MANIKHNRHLYGMSSHNKFPLKPLQSHPHTVIGSFTDMLHDQATNFQCFLYSFHEAFKTYS